MITCSPKMLCHHFLFDVHWYIVCAQVTWNVDDFVPPLASHDYIPVCIVKQYTVMYVIFDESYVMISVINNP